MNLIVTIDGREAIPVRAIPFLTNWELMSPDAITQALAHVDEDRWDDFFPLASFCIEGQRIKQIAEHWWANFPGRNLGAISATLKAREAAGELTYEQALIQWRHQSLLALPAGAFVWKDEFARCYSQKYSAYAITTIRNGEVLSEDEQSKLYALDFDPFIAEHAFRTAVMEGFAPEDSELSAALLPPVEPRARRGTPPALSPQQGANVVEAFQGGLGTSVSDLARQFHVHRRTIDKILNDAGVKSTKPR